MYCDWCQNQISKSAIPHQIIRLDLDDLYNVQQSDLCYTLSCLIGEAKKVDNNDFPPNSLREIIVMIKMYLNEHGVCWQLLDQQPVIFQYFGNVVNNLMNLMRQRTAMGLVANSVILLGQEDKMFESGILGEYNPSTLLKIVIYMLGLHIALRGGVEHTRLHRPGFYPQITVSVDGKGYEILLYCEGPSQKTNQGGLDTRFSTKRVQVYGSPNLSWCLVVSLQEICWVTSPTTVLQKVIFKAYLET